MFLLYPNQERRHKTCIRMKKTGVTQCLGALFLQTIVWRVNLHRVTTCAVVLRPYTKKYVQMYMYFFTEDGRRHFLSN